VARYSVTVKFTQIKYKEIISYAETEEAAEEKAVAVVLKWEDVLCAQAIECEDAE
jgi:hypothetical protein